ncbi:MAG: hypothetical protein FWC96_07185 [Oscillospiraceae bacterium]|nr:hypothetical protein [Oscillospiraceae bacterium]
MKNWQKTWNYRKYENTDGSFTYVIIVDDKKIEVSADVYKAYSQSDRRERYCAERDAGRLLSIEQFEEDRISLESLLDEHVESAEDSVIHILLAEQAMAAFMTLESDEQHLIQALVIDGMTERDYAEQIGLSQKGVNKRKHKILEKLKNSVLKPQGYRLG